MSANVLFSIVVPVYNVAEYLPRCVQSLREQTDPAVEIILVDDGSPDACPQLCDAYARQDARVRVLHKENGGLSDARNAGVLAAQGEYILFVDADDYIAADTCERLRPFAKTACDIIIADGTAVGADKRLHHANRGVGKITDGRTYLKNACRCGAMPMAAWLYVYRREFLLEKDLFFKKGILHEDEQFTPRAFLAAKSVTESGVDFYRYVIREDSITTAKDLRRNADDFYATCLELRGIYAQLEDSELKRLLLDSLAVKYLSLFQQGRLCRYGGTYLHRRFVWMAAKRPKTRCKALLYCVSPRLYWYINDRSKRTAYQ